MTDEPGDATAGQSFDALNLKTQFDGLRPFGIVADVSDYLASLAHRRKALVYIGERLDSLGAADPITANDWNDRRRLGLLRAVTAAPGAQTSPSTCSIPGGHAVRAPRICSSRTARATWSSCDQVTSPRSLKSPAASPRSRPVLVSQIDRIISDISAYYLLGYEAGQPSPRNLAGRVRRMVSPWDGFRHIEVRTTRPGVRLRARRGYWPDVEAGHRADSARSSTTVVPASSSAVRGLVPRVELGLASFAARFRGRNGRPVIAVALEVRDAGFSAAAASGFDETLEVSLVAAEPGAKVVAADRFTTRMRLGRDKSIALAGNRYFVCATLPVSPRRYQLRIGAHSAIAGAAGSVYQDVVVPDFERRPLSMSGVVLGLATTRSPMPVARRDTLAPLMPFPPTLARSFTADDRVRMYKFRSIAAHGRHWRTCE